MDTKDRANWMWLLLILKISRKHLIKFCVTDVLRVQSCNHASNNHKQVESKNSKLFKEKQGARSRKKSSMKETGVATTNLWPCIAHSEIDVQTNIPTDRGTTDQKHISEHCTPTSNKNNRIQKLRSGPSIQVFLQQNKWWNCSKTMKAKQISPKHFRLKIIPGQNTSTKNPSLFRQTKVWNFLYLNPAQINRYYCIMLYFLLSRSSYFLFLRVCS